MSSFRECFFLLVNVTSHMLWKVVCAPNLAKCVHTAVGTRWGERFDRLLVLVMFPSLIKLPGVFPAGICTRLLDLLENHGLARDMKSLDSLIFDEADQLLEMGFRPAIENILRSLKQSKVREHRPAP